MTSRLPVRPVPRLGVCAVRGTAKPAAEGSGLLLRPCFGVGLGGEELAAKAHRVIGDNRDGTKVALFLGRANRGVEAEIPLSAGLYEGGAYPAVGGELAFTSSIG